MKKRHLWPAVYGSLLTLFTIYVLLDAFVIPRSYVVVGSAASGTGSSPAQSVSQTAEESSSTAGADSGGAESSSVTATPVVTSDSYDDGSVSIKITQYREYDTDIYVADITLTDPKQLSTAFAYGTFGKNVTDTTSAIASDNGAILAINGDYYGTRNGYVIRDGVLYRDTMYESGQQDLVINEDGSFKLVTEGSVTAGELLEEGAWQVLSFGPGLVENGNVIVDESAEVDRAKTSNPRTAIGIIDGLHYVMVVTDGRTDESAGLSLYQLAEFMQSLGVDTAYNLDGGGSSTMVFNGEVVNNPTTNGNKISERKVSDIVYIA